MTSDKQLMNFKPGDRVKLIGLSTTGEILEGPDSKAKYLVLIGNMKSWCDGDKLKLIKQPKQAPVSISKPQKYQNLSSASLSLDLHGKTQIEASQLLDQILDRALLKGCSQIEIVHGLGTGTIKSLVWKWAKAQSQIKSFKLAEANPGTTICWL